jgi:aminoglycoside phosphotransferase (APT) family kinase protein
VATDRSLTQVAALVRAFHDLTAGTLLAADQEVVCHNDLSPKNTVYRDDGELLPVAFIDWDLAGPGSRVHDVAHVCWQYLRLGNVGPHWAGPRIRLICDACGLGGPDRDRLIDTVLWWQDRCWRGIEEQAARGMTAMERLRQAGVPAAIRAARTQTSQNRQTLETYL